MLLASIVGEMGWNGQLGGAAREHTSPSALPVLLFPSEAIRSEGKDKPPFSEGKVHSVLSAVSANAEKMYN